MINEDTHQKFRYPWMFPTLPQANLVAEQIRNTMCFVFGQTYEGFCPEAQPNLADNHATVSLSVDCESELEDVDEALAALAVLASENAKSDGLNKD